MMLGSTLLSVEGRHFEIYFISVRTLYKINCTYHTNGVLYDTGSDNKSVISTPTVPYNPLLVWYAQLIFTVCIAQYSQLYS